MNKLTYKELLVKANTEMSNNPKIRYIGYGLKKGKHTVSLELVDAENEVVPGHFNFVTRTIAVH